MTVIIIIMALAIAFLIIMIYAGQVYTAELEDRITELERKNHNTNIEIGRLDGKTDRLIRRIKEIENGL